MAAATKVFDQYSPKVVGMRLRAQSRANQAHYALTPVGGPVGDGFPRFFVRLSSSSHPGRALQAPGLFCSSLPSLSRSFEQGGFDYVVTTTRSEGLVLLYAVKVVSHGVSAKKHSWISFENRSPTHYRQSVDRKYRVRRPPFWTGEATRRHVQCLGSFV